MAHQASLSKLERTIKYCMLGMSIICALFFLIIGYRYISTKNTLYNNAHALAQQTTQKTAHQISQVLLELSSTVTNLANDLSTGQLGFDAIEKRLQEKPAHIYGLGVAFAPYAYQATKKLYAPYAIEKRLTFLQDTIDYTAPTYERFAHAFGQGPTLHTPFIDPVSKNLVVEFSAPFFDKNKRIIGIVFGNYTVTYLQHVIEALYPSRFGYESIIAHDGTYVLHPNRDFVELKRKAPDVARQAHDEPLAHHMEQAIAGKLKFFDYKNLVSGQKSWLFFEPIPQTLWYAAGTFVVDDIVLPTHTLDVLLILLFMTFIAFLLFLIAYALRLYVITQRNLRIISTLISCGIISIITCVWYQEWQYTGRENNKIIEKNTDLESLIEESYAPYSTYTKQISTQEIRQTQKPILIPTGIYIHKLSVGVDSITVVGYIWQKYPKEILKTVIPGIMLPQARQCTIQEAYRIQHPDGETIGWSIRCTLQQNFNFQDYPIDAQNVKIILWPTMLDDRLALIPDLDSYKTLNPSALPGVNRSIKLQNWDIDRSYFNFEKETYATNFGFHSPGSYSIVGSPPRLRVPKLAFNIVINRYASNTILLCLLPILVILTLLFIVIVMARVMKFSHLLASISSLFFTSLVAYGAFKSNLPIQRLIFFDYIYFVVHLAILLAAILGIIYYKKFKIRLIHYDHMFIPQILFWPSITLSILIISLLFFVYY